MSSLPNGDQMVRDLQTCNRLVEGILAERDRLKTEVESLRAPRVLWKVIDVDDGEVVDWFTAPVGWAPLANGKLIRGPIAHALRVESVGEIPHVLSEDEALTYIRQEK